MKRFAAIALAAAAAGAAAAGVGTTRATGPEQVARAVQAKPAAGQPLIAAARAGTQRYRSLDAAIADGYRRVGVHFPSMGEHWVNLQRVMEDTLVFERPAVLIYARVRGEPALVGVAYTALLDDDEQPPGDDSMRAYWHEHNGSVAEESFPMGYAAHAHAAAAGAQLRLSILHLWAWAENPAGALVTDNWTLPFVCAGLAPPPAPPPAAANMLALALDGEEYLTLIIRTGAELAPDEIDVVGRVLRRHRAAAGNWLAEVRPDTAVSSAALDDLARRWDALWSDLEQVLPVRAAALRKLRVAL